MPTVNDAQRPFHAHPKRRGTARSSPGSNRTTPWSTGIRPSPPSRPVIGWTPARTRGDDALNTEPGRLCHRLACHPAAPEDKIHHLKVT